MLVHVQNPTEAHSRTAIAGEAMKNGMAVKLAANTARGEEPKVMKAVAADLANPAVMCGIVIWVPENDLTVDFAATSPASNRALALNTGTDNSQDIPSGAHVTFWYNNPVVLYHLLALDASVDMVALTEGEPVAFKESTSLPTDYDAVEATQDVVAGFVYRNGTKFLEIIFTTL